jgi:WD40 repeat protein
MVLAVTGLAVRADDDPYGDPLPAGAKTRLGTVRYRYHGNYPPVVTPDGKTIFADDGWALRKYDIAGVPLGPVPAGYPNVMPIAFAADGARAVSINNSIDVWDVATGKILLTLKRAPHFFDRSLRLADLSADGKVLAVGAVKRDAKEPVEVLVWDVDAKKELARFLPLQNEQALVAIAPDGKTIATWGRYTAPPGKADPLHDPGRDVNFWDAATGKPLSRVRVAGYGPRGVTFSPDGTSAAVAGVSSVELVDPRTGATKQLLLVRSGVGRAFAFSPDGTTLFAASDAGVVQRWRTADGSRLSTTEPPAPNLNNCSVRATAADRGIASARDGGALVVWEVPSGKVFGPQTGHVGSVQHLRVTPDSKFVLTSAYGGQALKWELATGKLVGPAPGQPWQGRLAAGFALPEYAPGGAHALLNEGGGVAIHDTATGMQQFVIPFDYYAIRKAAFTADGSKVVTAEALSDGAEPAVVHGWDVAAAKRLFSLRLPAHTWIDATLTPDGKHVVTVSYKRGAKGNGHVFLQVWEASGGAKKHEFTEPATYAAGMIATAIDNQATAVVTSKGLARFDIAAGKLTPVACDIQHPAAAPVFSPDGKLLAVLGQSSFGRSAPVAVIDWATGKTKHSFTCPDGGPTCAAFSPDGRYLITGTNLATALVWNLRK